MRRRNRRHGLGEDLVKGAIAGAVATFVMDRATTFLYQREDRRAREREDEARGGTTAYESVAEKGAALVGTRLTRAAFPIRSRILLHLMYSASSPFLLRFSP